MINNNLSNYSFTSMNNTSSSISKNINALSSGSRINSSADNPADMAMITKMQTQVDGFHMAKRNTSDGISMVQTAEGALGSQQSILQRVRELSVQASNGSLSQSDRDVINNEAQSLMEDYQQIADDTSFNGHRLLDGSEGSIVLQTGPNSGDTNQVNLSDTSATTLGVSPLDLSSQASASASLSSLDDALSQVSDARSSMGSYQGALETRIEHLNISSLNTERAKSRIADVDYAKNVSELIKDQILQQSQLAMFAQAKISSERVLTLLQ